MSAYFLKHHRKFSRAKIKTHSYGKFRYFITDFRGIGIFGPSQEDSQIHRSELYILGLQLRKKTKFFMFG